MVAFQACKTHPIKTTSQLKKNQFSKSFAKTTLSFFLDRLDLGLENGINWLLTVTIMECVYNFSFLIHLLISLVDLDFCNRLMYAMHISC